MAVLTETRDRYCYWLSIPTRWQDGDPYGHVNNVVYYSWFDTVLTKMLLEYDVLKSSCWRALGLCVESHCAFHAPVSFPEVVDAGLRIGRIGNSTLRYEIGLFLQGKQSACADGYFVHVFVDPESRRPTPLAEPVRIAMQTLVFSEGVRPHASSSP